jgi:hypothetical protein
MAAPNISELRALDLEARLALVQELWDSIVEDAQRGAELSLSVEERRALDDRLREDDEDPDGALPWSAARRSFVVGVREGQARPAARAQLRSASPRWCSAWETTNAFGGRSITGSAARRAAPKVSATASPLATEAATT